MTVIEYFNRMMNHYHGDLLNTCNGLYRIASEELSANDLRELVLLMRDHIPMDCPDKGSFVGYKKAFCFTDDRNYLTNKYTYNFSFDDIAIITLEIPSDAKRSSAFRRKCRCDKAIVRDIQKAACMNEHLEVARSIYYPDFLYHVGETVKSDLFDENRFNECSNGIHFFMNRLDALKYLI